MNVKSLLYLFTTAIFLTGCQSEQALSEQPIDKPSVPAKQLMQLAKLNQLPKKVHIEYQNAVGKFSDDALNIQFLNEQNTYAAVILQPENDWDWSQFENFNLALDIANFGERSTQVYLDITDGNGDTYTRTVNIPVGQFHTYYAKLAGHDLPSTNNHNQVELNFTSGLRSNPDTWHSNETQFISMWGKKNLDVAHIKKIVLSVQSALFNKTISIKNLRLRRNPPMDKQFLTKIVDQYGQNAKLDYTGKIHSDSELIKQRESESKILAAGMMADRSQFSGWKNGPKLKATGYFRTTKYQDKWALVDPQGYLFFSTGIDNIRLSNTSTMTGYDFPSHVVPQRHHDDITPEDSQGLNRVPNSAVPQRYLASTTRANMFKWLPEYNQPLGKHFGYRRSAHSGPLKKGETFSFYSANLERKYASANPNFMQAWQQTTLNRMNNWGFTSLGNWADPVFYRNTQVPYFANGWIVGDFKTVSSGNDFWAPMPDVFDPKFEQRAMFTVQQIAKQVNDSPWCVGVFIDNEKSFGRPETNESHYGIVLNTLTRNGKTVPTKAKFTQLMQRKYTDIASLNRAWGTQISSWQEFNHGFDSKINTQQQLADYALLLSAYAEQYFAIVSKAVKTYMPNHLYMGARFPDWGMPIEVVKAAAKYADVISFNAYKEGLHKKTWAFLAEIDKPAIIGEFHMGAKDSGLFHPGLIQAANQQDRANMYTDYMNSVLENPYFVGAHWFQYIDSPITGRAYDGENYNVGFVSVTDTPYQPLVEAAKAFNKAMYLQRYGKQ